MSFELGEPKPPDEMFFEGKAAQDRVENFSDDMVTHKDLFETISEAHYLPELGGPHDEALLESLVEKGCEDNQILGQTLDKLANLVHGSGEYPEEEEDMLISGGPVTDIIDRLGQSLGSPGRSSITAAQGLLHLHHIGDHLPPPAHSEMDQNFMSDQVYSSERHEENAMETLAAASEMQEANQVNHVDYDQSAEKRLDSIVDPTDVTYTEPVPETNETYNKKCSVEPQPQSLPDQSESTTPSGPSRDDTCENLCSTPQRDIKGADDEPETSHQNEEINSPHVESKISIDQLCENLSKTSKELTPKHQRPLTPLAVNTEIPTLNTNIEDNLSDKSDDQPRDLSVHRRVPASATPHVSPRSPRTSEISRAPSRESDEMQSPQPSGIPALPETNSPEIFTVPTVKSKHTLFLESLLSSPSPKMYTSEVTITKQQCEPLNLGKHRKSGSPTVTSCSDELKPLVKEFGEPQEKKPKRHSPDAFAKISKVFNSKCNEDLNTNEAKSKNPVSPPLASCPLKQFQMLKSSPDFYIPDPILVPKDRLNLIIENPGQEIPALLMQRPDLRLPDAFRFPELLQNPDILVVSLSQIEKALYDKKKLERPKEEVKSEKLKKEPTSTSKSPKPPAEPQVQSSRTNQQRNSANAEDLAGEIDAANLSQMMWFPYQMDLLSNLEIMKTLNAAGYNGPNYPDLAALNSSRFMGLGGFPMMPPMDYDTRLQYAMQENMARMYMQQQSQSSHNRENQRSKSGSMDAPIKDLSKSTQPDVQNPYVHSTKSHQNKTQAARTSPIAHNYNNQRAMGHNQFLQCMYPGMNPNLRSNMPLPGLQIPYFNPQMMGSQRSPRTSQQKSPTSPFYPNNNYLQSLKQNDPARSGSAGSQDSPRPRISVKSLQNLMEPAAASGTVAARIGPSRRASIAVPSMGRRREEPEVGSTTPCEPPQHMPPHPHDPAAYHLWHPLFGNQKSPYTPWNWTTVTATGD